VTEFDPEHLLEVLVDEGVDFVLVGGYAAVLHGASRPSEDVDVTPAMTEDNLTRLTKALERLNAKIRTDAVPGGLPFSTSAEAMRGLLMLNLTTEAGDLDITFRPSGTEGYPDLIQHAEERSFGTITIRVAALADIVRSKEAAGRDKDIRALTELYELLHRKGE
jgi:predicted nucleotidyltransferase